jgi:hypothetical protein
MRQRSVIPDESICFRRGSCTQVVGPAKRDALVKQLDVDGKAPVAFQSEVVADAVAAGGKVGIGKSVAVDRDVAWDACLIESRGEQPIVLDVAHT